MLDTGRHKKSETKRFWQYILLGWRISVSWPSTLLVESGECEDPVPTGATGWDLGSWEYRLGRELIGKWGIDLNVACFSFGEKGFGGPFSPFEVIRLRRISRFLVISGLQETAESPRCGWSSRTHWYRPPRESFVDWRYATPTFLKDFETRRNKRKQLLQEMAMNIELEIEEEGKQLDRLHCFYWFWLATHFCQNALSLPLTKTSNSPLTLNWLQRWLAWRLAWCSSFALENDFVKNFFNGFVSHKSLSLWNAAFDFQIFKAFASCLRFTAFVSFLCCFAWTRHVSQWDDIMEVLPRNSSVPPHRAFWF